MGGMLGDSPHRHWQRGCGNGCCSPKAEDRSAKKAVKQREALELRQIVAEEAAPDESWDMSEAVEPHIYSGERCEFCNVNIYDNYLYGPFPCTAEREAQTLVYTTETPR
jgi:hypothetical protein